MASLKILVIEHFRVPYQNAGSEVMLHKMCKALQWGGHQVTIITTDTPQAQQQEEYDGIICYSVGHNRQAVFSLANSIKPDVIMSHHQRAEIAIPLAHRLRCKSIFVMHNDFVHNRRALGYRPSLVVFNTEWIKARWGKGVNALVVHPPVFPQVCQERGALDNRVTLVNLNRDKGGEILYQLAKDLPGIGFLGVVGAHGNQVIRHDLENVVIQEHTTNMCADVWSKTQVLLVPSIYESYGMVGLEAASLGIPVLANPTPGLQESLDSGGWFIARANIAGYKEAITSLMYDSRTYSFWSQKAKDRFDEIDPAGELATFVKTVEGLCK